MPRTIPWLVGDASKKKGRDASPRKSRARSSSPASDLVNSDLDIVSGHVTPKAKARRRDASRSPSTSPPPEATKIEVEFMREGLNADDAFMMVEDEFDATARLFTQHIHHAEYARLKRLHKSRGVDTLANLGHGTDATTQQSRAVKIQIEAAENAKKRKSAGTDESENEDDFLNDPMLARLMTEDRRPNSKILAGLGKAKSNTRAAAGYSQSPRKTVRTKDVYATAPRSGATRISSIAEDEETDDEEDLDAGAPKTAISRAYRDVDPELNRPRPTTESTASSKPNGLGFFKAFNEKSKEERASLGRVDAGRPVSSTPAVKNSGATNSRQSGKSSVAEILARRRGLTQQPEPLPSRPDVRIKKEPPSPAQSRPNVTTSTSTHLGTQTSRASDILARRRVETVKIKEEDKPRTKAKPDDIPTFLF